MKHSRSQITAQEFLRRVPGGLPILFHLYLDTATKGGGGLITHQEVHQLTEQGYCSAEHGPKLRAVLIYTGVEDQVRYVDLDQVTVPEWLATLGAITPIEEVVPLAIATSTARTLGYEFWKSLDGSVYVRFQWDRALLTVPDVWLGEEQWVPYSGTRYTQDTVTHPAGYYVEYALANSLAHRTLGRMGGANTANFALHLIPKEGADL